MHPDDCRNDVLERDDHGLGMMLHLCMLVKAELTAYAMKPDGCCAAIAVREYVAGVNGACFDGGVVQLVDVLHLDNENITA